MIKGTKKRAKQNAREYVDRLIDLSGYDDLSAGIDKHAAVRQICCQEMGGEWSLVVFAEWCYGLPSAFDSAAFLYNGTSYDALAAIYENTPEERAAFEKRVPRAEADDRIIWMCYKVLSKDAEGGNADD